MAEVKRVVNEHGAIALADRLNGNDRTRPIVVITTPVGRDEPYIDAEEVVSGVGDLADIYLIATGPHTWTFSNMMPELTQVYGGAGRVYPLGHDWVAQPRLSPLRFAYDEQEGKRSTRALISDALHMAAAAGLVQTSRSRDRVQAEGVVGFLVPERALVKLDGQVAQVAQELTVRSVPLDRVLAVGMRVVGWLDRETNRLDITESILPAEVSVQSYGPGDVVLTEVTSVQPGRAELLLHPEINVGVTREDVTGNDLDDLRDLMTPGEVVPARILSAAPAWHVSLVDVDDDETPVPAAALIEGGPPWLMVPPAADMVWTDSNTADMPAALLAEIPTREPTLVSTTNDVVETPPRPTPALFDNRRRPAPTSQATKHATETMSLTIDGLRAEVRSLKGRAEELSDELRASTAERASLVLMRQELERQVARLEHEVKFQRARLRNARKPKLPTGPQAPPEFADPDQAFRYAVLTAWARRTPIGEQAARPLLEYDLSLSFLDSLKEVPGISLDKVADVAVEILTGRVQEVPGRQVHQLRESPATSRHVRRLSDGATCWRAALQVNSPQARRIHYWVMPGGRVEFSRIALHDDFRP